MSQPCLTYLKTRLADQAHGFADTTVDSKGFLWQRNHFEVANGLKRNTEILFIRPDKGVGVVILNRSDYITKMATILNDTTKFLKLGDISVDDTHKLEIKLQKQFLELFKKTFISRDVYDLIRPIGLQRPRMYGLSKLHNFKTSLCDLFCPRVIPHNMHWRNGSLSYLILF